MKSTISRRDLELLSAYLDGQLDARRKARLEARLQTETELSKTLEELSRTRALLRSAPKLKAPRSFKLRPEMVEKRQGRPVYPVFQFASALAMILLVFVLIGDYLILRTPAAGAPEMITLSEPTTLAMQAQDSVAEEPEGTAPEERTMSREAEAAGASEAPEAALEAAPTEPVAALTADVEGENALKGEEPEAETYAAPADEPEAELFTTPAEEPVPEGTAAAAPGEAETLPSAETEIQEIRKLSLPAVRIAELILALTALVTGIAAVILKNRAP